MEGEEPKPEVASEEAEATAPAPEKEESEPATEANGDTGEVVGSAAIRPVFLGNLKNVFESDQVKEVFTKPIFPENSEESFKPFDVDRIDVKRGYCFVFLKDATSEADKTAAERFVSVINGMEVPGLSQALRAEFARGDGRVKRKEDDRRKNIQPSETLFVVNFEEETTKREDLQMLFEPFGEIERIDMKRNYAFVQFKSVDEASKAKDATHGGELNQRALTVEFVARKRGDGDRRRHRRDNRGPRGGDRRGNFRYDRDRYDDRGRRDDYRRGRDYRGSSPGGYRGGYGRRSRSRSRSPPSRRYDDRDRGRYDSPPRRYNDRDNRDRYDDQRDGGRR